MAPPKKKRGKTQPDTKDYCQLATEKYRHDHSRDTDSEDDEMVKTNYLPDARARLILSEHCYSKNLGTFMHYYDHDEKEKQLAESRKLAPEKLSKVCQEKVPSLSQEKLAAVSSKQFPGISPEELPAISSDKLCAVSQEQLPAVSPEELPAMGGEQLPALSPEKLPAVSPGNLSVVTPEKLFLVTPDNVIIPETISGVKIIEKHVAFPQTINTIPVETLQHLSVAAEIASGNFSFVRRSGRSSRKPAKEVSPNVKKSQNVPSQIKSKLNIDTRSKENMELSEDKSDVVIKNKKRNESKLITENAAANSSKISSKIDSVFQMPTSKKSKKSKMPDSVALPEKENGMNLKHKHGTKDSKTVDGELRPKDYRKHVKLRRKRTYSETSKDEFCSADTGNLENVIKGNKRLRSPIKLKSTSKTKTDKLSNDSAKIAKRKSSTAPEKSNKIKNAEKDTGTPTKGKRIKSASLSEDTLPNETAKIEKKDAAGNEGSLKGVSNTTNLISPKPKFKKPSRRDSLRLITADEPPLFSQPDVMLKVKSDDNVKKREKNELEDKEQPDFSNISIKNDIVVTAEDCIRKREKNELEDKEQADNSNISSKKNDTVLKTEDCGIKKEIEELGNNTQSEVHNSNIVINKPDAIVKEQFDNVEIKQEVNELEAKGQSLQPLESAIKSDVSDNQTLEVTAKASEIPVITSTDNSTNSGIITETTETASEFSVEKDEYKDIDSENSLHIDENTEKIFETENEENVKSELNETDSSLSVFQIKIKEEDTQIEDAKEMNISSKSSTDLLQMVKTKIGDQESDKPIAERRPRRNIKRKEFFEEITSRSSSSEKKIVGRKKKDKSTSEEESKSRKNKSVSKAEVESELDSEDEDDPSRIWCICRKPHNNRFMISCDSCEEWFHGSCVGISRAQGCKLEKQKKEWICPVCVEIGPDSVSVDKQTLQKNVKVEEKSVVEVKKEPEAECSEGRDLESTPRKKKVIVKINEIITKNCKKVSSTAASTPDTTLSTSSKNDKTVNSSSLNKKILYKNDPNSATKETESSKKKTRKYRKDQNCVYCEAPLAYENICFCTDNCLEKHAADVLEIMRDAEPGTKGVEFSSEKIVCIDRFRGTVIAGENAPTPDNIVAWLKSNPGFMVACSTDALRAQATSRKKEGESASTQKDKAESSEANATVRLNVRKTLKNILMDRCKNAGDIQMSEEDIRKIGVRIEEELNNLFKENTFKYRAKYRSLMFNIKDPRNQGLFRKILQGSVSPNKLVRMSPEELASMELAKWREQENQHLLDVIKRYQLEQQGGSGLLLKKTHKGEVEIEDNYSFDTTTDDVPKSVPKPVSSETPEVQKPEPPKDIVKDTTDLHRSHLFDLNCKICTGKMLPPPVKATPPVVYQKKVTVAHSICKQQVSSSSLAATDPVEKSVSRVVDGKSPLSSTGDDSMEEPTSTVSIGSPEVSVRYIYESDSDAKSAASVWKGFIFMQDVTKFVTSAYKVSGQTEYLHMVVPDTIHVCGRIIPDQVWDYLGKIKQSGNKELMIIRFQAANDEESVAYNSFYSYLSTRKRYGVVNNFSKKIKDFYILPLAATSPVPIVLMPFDGPGLPSPRPHLLLGVIVRHKVKQAGPSVKEKSDEDTDKLDGSYTPPLDTRSYTPPLPALQTDNSMDATPDTVYSPSMDLKITSPSEISDATGNSVANKTDSDIYEPSYTPPLQILSSDSPKETDEDKPYDPEQDILNIDSECKDPKSSPNELEEETTENLEKHKQILDALTRQVEETDRQVNALKQLISQPDDSDAEYHSPSTQSLDINSVAGTGMSSFLDLPENLQDILNVVREKSEKEKSTTNKGDVDMRLNCLFGKSFNSSTYPTGDGSNRLTNLKGKSGSYSTAPRDDIGESSVRPSDPRIKPRTTFHDSHFSEESASVSLSKMSVSELVQRAEKELANKGATGTVHSSTRGVSPSKEKFGISSLDKASSACWNEFKEPPPPGIELSDLASSDSTYSSKTIPIASTSGNTPSSSYSSSSGQEAQKMSSHFPLVPLHSATPFPPPPLPPGYSIPTPPPSMKHFPLPPNVMSSTFPPPPIPVVTEASDASPAGETWPGWNIPPQQSKDNTWQSRVPGWDDNWKNKKEIASADCSESSSHYYPPGNPDFHKESFYGGDSSEGRWSRPSRFRRSNWQKRPHRGGHWRGRRGGSFYFNKNQRN